MRHLLLALLLLPIASLGEESVRHLFVAKNLLKRFEAVGLSAQQQTAFNQLSGALRKKVDVLRSEAGISKQTITQRDEAHRVLKGQKLPEADYWKQLQNKAQLDTKQLAGFQETQRLYRVFKTDAMALLNEEQRKHIRKAKAKTDNPAPAQIPE